MRVFQKGQVVIPVNLRKKYRIEIGDQVQLVQRPDGILLKAGKKKTRIHTKTDTLFGVFKDSSSKKGRLSKKAIHEATERELVSGWEK
jgi:bifunctional DNA-binding transcriptional regulator/antitoxin component of YhaV-PrlF toxin-antitoxin module